MDARAALGATGRPPRYLVERQNIVIEPLPERQAVYVLYQAVRNADVPIAEAARQLSKLLGSQKFERVVFDLRGNEGGNNNLNQPLLHALFRSIPFDEPGRIYVLTGPKTFSAALNFCSKLEGETQALFVGEPVVGFSSGRQPQVHSAGHRRRAHLCGLPRGTRSRPRGALAHRASGDERLLPPNARWERPSQTGADR